MARKSLSKKASFNALASLLDYGARVAVELVINPVLVTGLGGYLYGLWRILWRLNGYMDAAGGRSDQVLKWAVAKDQTLDNYAQKRSYIGGTIVVWFLFLPLLMSLGGLLIWIVPGLLKVPADYLWTTRLTIGLLALNVIVLGLADIPRAVLQGENLGYKRMGLSAFLVFAGGGLTVLAVYYELGLTGVAGAAVVMTLLTGMMFLVVAYRQVPWFGIAKPSRETVRWFSGLSGWFVVWKIVSQLMLAGDILLLGVFDSVALVAAYSLTKHVPETLTRMVSIVVFGVAPGLGGIIGAGDLEKAARVRSEIMSFSWLLLTVAGVCILPWNGVFVRLWVGETYYAGLYPTLLLIVMIAQIVLIRNDANIIDLTLNIRTKVLLGLLAETLALSLVALFVGRYDMGVVGVCAGCIAGRSIVSLAYPYLVGRFLKVSFYTQLKSALRPIFVSAVLFMLVLSAMNYQLLLDVLDYYALSYTVTVDPEAGMVLRQLGDWLLNSWSGLILGAAMTAAIASVFAFYGGLSHRHRKSLLKRLQGVTQRKKLA